MFSSPHLLQGQEWSGRGNLSSNCICCMQQMDLLQHLLIVVPWDFANLILTPDWVFVTSHPDVESTHDTVSFRHCCSHRGPWNTLLLLVIRNRLGGCSVGCTNHNSCKEKWHPQCWKEESDCYQICNYIAVCWVWEEKLKNFKSKM